MNPKEFLILIAPSLAQQLAAENGIFNNLLTANCEFFVNGSDCECLEFKHQMRVAVSNVMETF